MIRKTTTHIETSISNILAILSLCLYAPLTLAQSLAQVPAEQLYNAQIENAPSLAKWGKYNVGVETIVIDGPNQLRSEQPRQLSLEVWFPTKAKGGTLARYSDVTRAHQPFALKGQAFRGAAPMQKKAKLPLVIMSHGYTGYRSMMFYLGEHLASHGFVVASIDHTDSTNAEVDFIKNRTAGFPSTLLHRARDQQAVLEYFATQGKQYGADANKSSVVGYSMGGYGALNTAGGCYSFSTQAARSFGLDIEQNPTLDSTLNSCNAGQNQTDPRWKALVAFAPWGGKQTLHSKLDNIKIPALFVAGENDTISGYENGVKQLYADLGSEDKYLMVFKNAEHNVAPHPAPKVAYKNEIDSGHYVEAQWDTQVMNRINQHMVLAFLNCHVNAKKKACKTLPPSQQDNNKAWPGFTDGGNDRLLFFRN